MGGGEGASLGSTTIFSLLLHFTRGIISHHTRNNRPFQPLFFFLFFLFFFFSPYGMKESGEIRQLR